MVYKGTLRDERTVGIKQLLLEDTSGAVFERELKAFQDEGKHVASYDGIALTVPVCVCSGHNGHHETSPQRHGVPRHHAGAQSLYSIRVCRGWLAPLQTA